MTFDSYNEFHLGDNLVHLNFLRRLAREHPEHLFRHFVHGCYVENLRAVVEGVRNLELREGPCDKREWPNFGRDVWKNAGGFWESHPYKNDWVMFHLHWFAELAEEMAVVTPIRETTDLLFDYPELVTGPGGMAATPYDVLVVNSKPCSGQFMDFKEEDWLAPVIEALHGNGLRVICTDPTRSGVPCTRDFGMTVTDIGRLSLAIPYHVMVATGPMWPTFNIWNTVSTKLRLVLLGNGEQLNLPLANLWQVGTREEAVRELERAGLL